MGKARSGELRFAAGASTRSSVTLPKQRLDVGMQTGVVIHQTLNLAALLEDCVVPTVTVFASVGLIAPFQQVHHQHFEAAPQFAPVSFPQALKLVGQTVRIDFMPFPAPNEGGGISNSGTLTLMNSTVTGNSADAGGGIWNTGEMTMTLTNSTVTGNSAEVGGGIWNGGALTLMNSTVSGNVAAVGGRESGLGGGIYNVGMATVTNSTLSGNTDDGISNEGTMTLTSSTVEGYGTFSYGISNDGTLTMTNSLIVSDCEGDIVSNGYNIESPLEGPGDTCGFDRPTDQPSVSLDDLDFQPLADNGGPTMTHAITTDSAALNKIPPEDCEVDKDQRGVERPQGPTCDIGAFELEQP